MFAAPVESREIVCGLHESHLEGKSIHFTEVLGIKKRPQAPGEGSPSPPPKAARARTQSQPGGMANTRGRTPTG